MGRYLNSGDEESSNCGVLLGLHHYDDKKDEKMYEPMIYIYSKRKIEKEEELVYNYGKYYWKK